MSKKLIICEKPSLAKNVCNALAKDGNPVSSNGNGSSENSQYIVTSAFGHLYSLFDIEEYAGNYDPTAKQSWAATPLPFFPANDDFKFALKRDPKTKKTSATIKERAGLINKLLNRNDVDGVIHCGDSDREGEIIVRIILRQAGNKKPVYRLWLPDQVESTIISALSNLSPDSAYDNLAKEGYARTYLDWIYGINLTRYASLKCGGLLNIGRVIGAIVKTIYDRDMEIENFIPVDYFAVISNEATKGEIIELVSKNRFDKDKEKEAKDLADIYNKTGASVTDIQTDRKTIQAPKLFSQTTLQNAMSKRFKFPPKKTLDTAQKLYEKGLLTYPRTPTEYLATAEKGRIKAIIERIRKDGPAIVFKDKKTIFDDSKIESHSAITPTMKKAMPSDFADNDEKNLYETVYNRFCAVFCEEPCEVFQTVMTISVGKLEDFKFKGYMVITSGWKKFEPVSEEDKKLPNLQKGDNVVIDFKPVKKQTEPPKHYTVETLNNYLKNPFKDEIKTADDNDDADYKALLSGLEIGTEATRSPIIDKAINGGYISLTKTVYTILDKGKYLVENMEQLGIDMSKNKTVLLSKTIKDTYRGAITLRKAVQVAKDEVTDIIAKDLSVKTKLQSTSGVGKNIIGTCPRCRKHNVVETKMAYSCEDRECNFTLWKENAYFKTMKKKFTEKMAKDLVNKGSTLVKGLTSKKGNKFDAVIGINDENGKINFTMAFPEKKKKS